MNFLKKLFGQNGQTRELVEPIFPGEGFSIAKLTMKDGWSLATFNNKYNGYPNKSFFPWHVLIELETIEKNENGHPVDSDAAKLINLEEEITSFLRSDHKVHFIGRVTRNSFRDLLYYIDNPKPSQEQITEFCNGIMKERGINFTLVKDPTWSSVAGFIK